LPDGRIFFDADGKASVAQMQAKSIANIGVPLTLDRPHALRRTAASRNIHQGISPMDQNIFREYDIRGIVGKHLTTGTVATLARAIGSFFRENGARRIAIGYDARESSPGFCDILANGLNSTGCDAVLIGMVPTPVLYYSTFKLDVDGGVMITGSHNPADHNGFKICLGRSTLYGSQIQRIREIAESGEFAAGQGTKEVADPVPDYCREIVSGIKFGGRKIKAVVDAGNGMGGVTAVPVYRELGVEMTELFIEPDSSFPNHHPDPTVTENLSDVIAAVRQTGAAGLPIAFAR